MLRTLLESKRTNCFVLVVLCLSDSIIRFAIDASHTVCYVVMFAVHLCRAN